MSKSDEDKRNEKEQGVIMVLLERFNKQRLPRAEELKKKVDAGELLNDHDLALIQEVQNDSKEIGGLIERHPEYKELAAEVLQMWNEIMKKDLANREGSK